MRSNTIIIVIWCVLVLCSCRTAQQKKERDLEKFTELTKEHPDFIKSDSTNSETQHDLDSSGFSLETDSAAFMEALSEYREAVDSLEQIIKNNEHDSNTTEVKKILREKVREKFNGLTSGSLKPFSHIIVDKDSVISLRLNIDPKNKRVTYDGTYKKKKETIVRTVKQFVPGEVTNWQAFKKIGWLFAVLFALIIFLLFVIFLKR